MRNIAESGTSTLRLAVIERLSRREWNYVSERNYCVGQICFVALIVFVATEAVEIITPPPPSSGMNDSSGAFITSRQAAGICGLGLPAVMMWGRNSAAAANAPV